LRAYNDLTQAAIVESTWSAAVSRLLTTTPRALIESTCRAQSKTRSANLQTSLMNDDDDDDNAVLINNSNNNSL